MLEKPPLVRRGMAGKTRTTMVPVQILRASWNPTYLARRHPINFAPAKSRANSRRLVFTSRSTRVTGKELWTERDSKRGETNARGTLPFKPPAGCRPVHKHRVRHTYVRTVRRGGSKRNYHE